MPANKIKRIVLILELAILGLVFRLQAVLNLTLRLKAELQTDYPPQPVCVLM